jgi:hypothetical protein
MSQGIPCQETKVPELGRLTSPLRAAPCQLNSPAGARSPEVESLCGSALVSMVKPADFRHGDNLAQFRRFNRSSIWTVISDNHFFGLIQALTLPYGSSALASLMLHHIDQLSERISDIEPAYPPRLTVWPIFDRESRLPDSGQCLVQVVNFN